MSAAAVGRRDASPMSFGEAAFEAYFGPVTEEMEKRYYNHMVKVAGF